MPEPGNHDKTIADGGTSSPAVTIVTPTKNRRALLAEAIASVRAQTLSDWEHLVIDDGSDDGTVEMVAEIAAVDPRIRFLRREGERAGANVCRNLGIREARGEFLVFLDSDDLLTPGCLEGRVEVMRRNLDLGFAVFLTGFFVKTVGDRRQQDPEEQFGDDLLRLLTFDLPWIINAPIWRASALQGLGGFDEDLPSWQDVDLHLRAICRSIRYLKLPKLDHHVRWQFEETKVSVRQRRSPEHLRAAESTLAKFEAEVRNGPGLDWCRQRAICGLHFFLAERWAEVGELGEALRVWGICRKRGLLPHCVHAPGCLLLTAKRIKRKSELVRRAINKWMGVVRMRSNPDLIAL